MRHYKEQDTETWQDQEILSLNIDPTQGAEQIQSAVQRLLQRNPHGSGGGRQNRRQNRTQATQLTNTILNTLQQV